MLSVDSNENTEVKLLSKNGGRNADIIALENPDSDGSSIRIAK